MNKSKHPETLKIYNSSAYRKKVKRMVELAKTIRGISWGKKLPPRRKLGNRATQEQREKFAAADRFVLDKGVIHYFAHVNEAGFAHRDES